MITTEEYDAVLAFIIPIFRLMQHCSPATVVEAPCDLSTLTARYTQFGSSFISEQSAAKKQPTGDQLRGAQDRS